MNYGEGLYMEVKEWIRTGNACLGIELGSTRIKAVLIGPDHMPIASGDFGWENRLEGGYWTYHMEEVWTGLRSAYAGLRAEVRERYGLELTRLRALGISGMMHGYLPLDGEGEPLAAFRTWRNTTTGRAAEALTRRFSFNIPQRWSIAHLYQAMLNGEAHVHQISYLTTLAGYVHWRLTGRRVLGVGEASGMFPIDSGTGDYDQRMVESFDALAEEMGFSWKLRDILPQVLCAGEEAGMLTEEGARLLDPSGALCAGVPMAPPEGDAGTGMVATNAVAKRTGNVSAGTSIFAMLVLEHPLSRVYPEIDLVTTPDGAPVAMVHCNNCTNEINAWAQVFQGFLEAMGEKADRNRIFSVLFGAAQAGAADGGGLVPCNYLSGEPIAGLEEGRPMLVRTPDAVLSFPNLMRAQLYSALATLRIGLDILAGEQVAVDRLLGHGGFFKTPVVGQKMLAAAANVPVSVMETAGEGGPWGMALLAAYLVERSGAETLEHYLDSRVFAGQRVSVQQPDPEDRAGFEAFLARYVRGLAVERAAVEHL